MVIQPIRNLTGSDLGILEPQQSSGTNQTLDAISNDQTRISENVIPVRILSGMEMGIGENITSVTINPTTGSRNSMKRNIVSKTISTIAGGISRTISSLFSRLFRRQAADGNIVEASINSRRVSRNRQQRQSEMTQEAKNAVEQRAILLTREYYENQDMVVLSVEAASSAQELVGELHPGYDLVVQENNEQDLHVEVKGTTGDSVKVTHNEMRTAVTDQEARLAIVSGIEVTLEEGEWIATGGELNIYRWTNIEPIIEVIQMLDEISVDIRASVSWRIDGDSDMLY